MKTFIPIAVLATAVAAQTSVSGSSSACAADYIVETCLGTENAILAACGTADYVCQCNAYGALLTCFNNCPNDSRIATYKGQQQIFCGYASQFPSSTAKDNAVTTTSGSVAAETTPASATTSSGSTGTASGTASSATKTNSAAELVLNAGGVLAAVAGVVVAVL